MDKYWQFSWKYNSGEKYQPSPVLKEDDTLSQDAISSSNRSLLYSLTAITASLSMCLPPLNLSSTSGLSLWNIQYLEKMASREDMILQHILWVNLQEEEIKFFKAQDLMKMGTNHSGLQFQLWATNTLRDTEDEYALYSKCLEHIVF